MELAVAVDLTLIVPFHRAQQLSGVAVLVDGTGLQLVEGTLFLLQPFAIEEKSLHIKVRKQWAMSIFLCLHLHLHLHETLTVHA